MRVDLDDDGKPIGVEITAPSISKKTPKQDPETKRLWKKFQQLIDLPEKDRRAVIRLLNSLGANSKIRNSAA